MRQLFYIDLLLRYNNRNQVRSNVGTKKGKKHENAKKTVSDRRISKKA